jgi:hypothetical protein
MPKFRAKKTEVEGELSGDNPTKLTFFVAEILAFQPTSHFLALRC